MTQTIQRRPQTSAEYTPLFGAALSIGPAAPLLPGLVVINFAGGGGASWAIHKVLGTVDHAINHSRSALGIHAVNMPDTMHHITDVWDVDPRILTGGQKVYLAQFSPDCRNHSRASAGKPRDKKVRGQIWLVLRYAALVEPDMILVENVPEIRKYGPLDNEGRVIKDKEGIYYNSFILQLQGLGYTVEARDLVAADYGAATSRTRYCLIARRDGKKIVWPDATHAPLGDARVQAGELPAHIPAGQHINWTLPVPTVFSKGSGQKETRLGTGTMQRLARGFLKYHLSGDPYVVGEQTASLMVYRKSAGDTGQELTRPIRTITTTDGYALVTASIVRQMGESVGSSARAPIGTIMAGGAGGKCAVLSAHSGAAKGQDHGEAIYDLLTTYLTPEQLAPHVCHTAKRVYLTHGGVRHEVRDIGMRFLTGRELFDLSGFPPDYEIDVDVTGARIGHTEQVKLVGNAVPPPLYEAITRANTTALSA